MNKDYLSIQNNQEELKLGINFGYIDRVAGIFDFQRSTPQNVTGYKLLLDLENTDEKTLCALEQIIKTDNKFINAIISLDGIISKGRAKIAQIFSLDGLSYDIELIN